MKVKRLIYFIPLAFVSCMQNEKITLEYINAPVDLIVTSMDASTYELSFYSDNREGNFSGYGVFVGVSAAAVNTDTDSLPIDTSAATAFCATSSQIIYASRVKIRVGATSGSDTLCNLTALSLSSGQFVGLRARVEREEKAWSHAAIARAP
ncbi:MAG TPA: hypothetical protein PLY93_14320 [Turneriella sp.]|nr:hypothetical protein [Turneriella sp.]